MLAAHVLSAGLRVWLARRRLAAPGRGNRLPLGCVRSRRQGQARPPAAQLRGSSQYGITCTALSGATPCGWDDFTTDKTAAQLFYPCPDGS